MIMVRSFNKPQMVDICFKVAGSYPPDVYLIKTCNWNRTMEYLGGAMGIYNRYVRSTNDVNGGYP